MNDVRAFVEAGAIAVEQDLDREPATASDGIWRFDRILNGVFGKHDKEFWREVASFAREKNAMYDGRTWTGYGIVAAYASNQAAFMTPGFASARREWMT